MLAVQVNGEIYNHELLKAEMQKHNYHTQSDCEVIAHLVCTSSSALSLSLSLSCTSGIGFKVSNYIDLSCFGFNDGVFISARFYHIYVQPKPIIFWTSLDTFLYCMHHIQGVIV